MSQHIDDSGLYAGVSDARLTELLRTDSPTAYLALQELRTRHRASVLAYARLCTTSDSTAGQLAAQAFTTAARDAARGAEPNVPWRHQLLLLTADLAATWATDERAAGLDPSLLLVLNTLNTAGGEPLFAPPPMLGPFQSLPARVQGIVWYGIVERESEERTAALLGLTPEDVTYETEPALQALAQACLRSRLAVSEDPRCQDFRRLIEESVRPVNPRHSTDLNSHMVICPHCSVAYEELSALRDSPRTALGEGLLPWCGTAYARDAPTVSRANAPVPGATWSRPAPAPTPSRRGFALASVVLGVALVPLLIVLMSSGDGSPIPQGASNTLPVTAVPSGPEATAPSSSSAPKSPSPSPTSRPPTSSPPAPKPTPKPTPTPTPTPTPVFRAPGASYAQVVNVASGRCLDIRGGVLEKGTDVLTAPCSASAETQRWRVDAELGVLRSGADTDLCLDSRGDVDRGVGIWECASVDGDNGDNLRFTVDEDGVIRPAIAFATGLTPDSDGGVTFVALTGGTGQRWRAGAA